VGPERNLSAIEVSGLTKRYGSAVEALRGVSFQVPRGGVFGLLGPNGAGKSTTVRILATLSRADGGTARVNGLDVATQADAVRRSIGYVAQEFTLYGALSVDENLDFFAESPAHAGVHDDRGAVDGSDTRRRDQLDQIRAGRARLDVDAENAPLNAAVAKGGKQQVGGILQLPTHLAGVAPPEHA